MSDFADEPGGSGGAAAGRRAPAGARPRRPRPLLLTIVVVAAVVIGFSLFASIWTDKLWYSMLGYGSVFSKLVWTRVLLFVVFGLVMALVVGVNLGLAYRLRPMFRPHSPEQANLERYREVITPLRRILLIGVSLVFGLFTGISATGNWRIYLLWTNRQSFGKADPYFHKDIGFYVFSLPWLHYAGHLRDDRGGHRAGAGGGRALPVRRDPAAVGGRQGLRRRAGPALRALRRSSCCSRRVDYYLDRFDLTSAQRRPGHRHDLHPLPRRAARRRASCSSSR